MALSNNQWVRGGDNAGKQPKRLGGPQPKLSKRLSAKFDAGVEKTKDAAKKVKDGAFTGVNWIKINCAKNKLFHKK